MHTFLKFLWQYRYAAMHYFLFLAVFGLVFYLYSVPWETVLYGGILYFFVFGTFMLVRFIHFRRKHRLLQTIYQNLPLMTENLPEPDLPIEEDLHRIIRRLEEISTETLTKMKNTRQDSLDYYTVWIHQIKTPISAMQMLLQSEDTAQNRELLAELFRIEQYAEMALCYLRLDSSSTDYVIRKYDLDRIIRKAVHRFAPQFIRRKIRLVYEPVNFKALTDEKWLLFMLEQLLSNAVKYAAGSTVTIRCTDGILTVEDTGMGICAEDIPRIFEKGFTGMSGRTDRKSTGLGLYLCKRAAGNLGHTITVRSQVGKGSAFSIDLRSRELDIE